MTEPPSPIGPLVNPHDGFDGYADDAVDSGAAGSDEDHEGGGHSLGRSEEGGRMSFQDEEDYSRQPRVLKVRFFFWVIFYIFYGG
jgi:hypothetical protein